MIYDIECLPKSIRAEIVYNIVIRNRLPGNTGRINRSIYVMLKFTERPKTPGMASKKTLLSLKGISCLQMISC